MTREVLLEDVAQEVTVGHVGSMADEYLEDGIPFLRSLNIQAHRISREDIRYISPEFHGRLKKSALRPGDVVIVRTGKPGTCAVIPNDLPVANCSDLVIVRCGPEIRPRFLAYWVNAIASEHVASHLVGAVQQHFNVGAAKKMPIVLPHIAEQDRILSILGALDDKIELNRRMSATLEEMARALYRSWFVDFDPVHARALGQPPAHMDAPTAALFPDSFGPDGLPNGWERRPIGTLIEDTIGGDWGKEAADEKHDTPIGIIRGTDFPGLSDGGKAGVPTRYSTRKKADRRSLRPFDIVLEVSGGSPKQPTGRTLLITQAELDRFDEVMVPASFCRRLRPSSRPDAILAYLHAQQLYIDGGTWSYQNQSTGISNFQTPRFLEEEAVVHPCDVVLSVFRCITEPLLLRARTNENSALATLRDALLPRLMSGELSIRDAEKQVENAL